MPSTELFPFTRYLHMGHDRYTEDEKPLIGQAPGQEGFWVCAGFNGHGSFLPPVLGEGFLLTSCRHGTGIPFCCGLGHNDQG